MADETPQAAPAAPTIGSRAEAIKAYVDAETKEARKALVIKYPFLSEIFASVNHD